MCVCVCVYIYIYIYTILPENFKTCKVPLINSKVRAAYDVAAVELQARLEADAAVL